MKSLVLLRHGESIRNKENRFVGWMDIDLSEMDDFLYQPCQNIGHIDSIDEFQR